MSRPEKAAVSGNTVTESTTIVDADGKKQTFYKTVTNVKQTWQQMSRRSKIFLAAYGCAALVNMSFETYNSGKQSLLEHRKRVNTNYSSPLYNSEWEAVRRGCAAGSFERFWRGVLWPCSIVSNIMPNVILFLNPAKPVETK